jgi:hypothetical protein
MPLVGFKPTISAGKRPHTYAIDRAATGTCYMVSKEEIIVNNELPLIWEGEVGAFFGDVPFTTELERFINL